MCKLDYCDNKGISGFGLCSGHYNQHWQGRPLTPLRRKRMLHRDEWGRVCTTCDAYQSWDNYYRRSSGVYRAECVSCTIKRSAANKAARLAKGEPCTADRCVNPADHSGLCPRHYGREWMQRASA